MKALVEVVASAVPQADGPGWSQKYYVAWRWQSGIWLSALTGSPNRVLVRVRGLKLDVAELEALARRLGYEVFAPEAGLAIKLAMGSSVGYGSEAGEVNLNVKDEADVSGGKGDVLTAVLREAWTGFTGLEAREASDDPSD